LEGVAAAVELGDAAEEGVGREVEGERGVGAAGGVEGGCVEPAGVDTEGERGGEAGAGGGVGAGGGSSRYTLQSPSWRWAARTRAA
jgi:hypothetical protein